MHHRLSLAVRDQTEAVDLNDALVAFFADEAYDQGRQQYFITNLPKILFLNPLRYHWPGAVSGQGVHAVRTKTPINLPLLLNLSKFLHPKSSQSAVYRLSAVIVHRGNTQAGHYMIYARVDNQWCTRWSIS